MRSQKSIENNANGKQIPVVKFTYDQVKYVAVCGSNSSKNSSSQSTNPSQITLYAPSQIFSSSSSQNTTKQQKP